MTLLSFFGLAILIGVIAYVFRDVSVSETDKGRIDSVCDLRTLLDTTDESVMLLRRDGTLIEINQTALKQFELTRNEMIGRHFLSFLPDEVTENRQKSLATVLHTRQPLVGEEWRNGHCLAWRMHPVIENENTQIERIWVFAKDVTAQRQMQAMDAVFQQLDRRLLHQQSDIRELALQLCTGLIPLFGLSSIWLGKQELNRQLAFVAGAGEAAEALAILTISAVEADSNDGESNPVLAAIKTAEPRLVHDRMTDWALIDPQLILPGCNLLVALPIYLNDTVFGVLVLYGKTVDEARILTLFENASAITNHASLAIEAIYDQSQLRLYEQVLASTGTAVFITNPDGRITWVNEAFVRITGYSREEVIGQLPSIFGSKIHDKAFFGQMWETLSAGRVWRADVINQRRDGTHYHTRQTISPVQRSDGSITHFVALLEDITDEKKAVTRLEHLASHDSLTNLPNRLLFHDLLPRTIALARRQNRQCAILFIDLDRFKPINDTYGHAVGDKVLKDVAKRLLASLRQSDSAARIGGDEFAVILPDLTDRSEAELVAEKVIETINQPIHISDAIVTVGASIGIALFPEHSDDAELLAKLADEAMYRAKLEGRNRFCFYDSF